MRLAVSLLAVALPLLGQPALTIYNQNFAVVREKVPLELKQGLNQVRYDGATAFLEPESVILRDPAGRVGLALREQSYRADPVSASSLLRLYEGKSIEFLVFREGRQEKVTGKIIRSGYAPPAPQQGWQTYGSFAYASAGTVPTPAGQPVVEVDGKIQFGLPGMPLFPPLEPGTVIKPLLEWTIESSTAARLEAELNYISGMLNWEADYNIVASDKGDSVDLTGWVTMQNQSGKDFENARIKLMAGDVQKIAPEMRVDRLSMNGVMGGVAGGIPGGLPVTEKTFDEYHLYTLERAVSLHHGEKKQVEFLRVPQVKSRIVYVYEGAKIDDQRYRGWMPDAIRNDSSYGTISNPKVWVMREFENSKANRLGMPLPQGHVRFYRRDSEGRMEFTGEDTIQHTPADETLRVFTGAAFDLVGERKRTNFRVDHGRSMIEESFEIRVRNRKTEPVEVRVDERLYRWAGWEIYTSSQPFKKTESQKAEFTLALAPGEEKVVTYSVRYTW